MVYEQTKEQYKDYISFELYGAVKGIGKELGSK